MKADANALRVVDTIKAHCQECKTDAAIAEILNSMNVRTAGGGKWYDTTVRRYEKRLAVEVVKHWRNSDEEKWGNRITFTLLLIFGLSIAESAATFEAMFV